MLGTKDILIGAVIFGFAILGVTSMIPWSPPTPAATLKEKITRELSGWAETNNASRKLPLGNLGGMEWDWICFPGYYRDGVKTADLLSRQEGFDLRLFDIADEYYLDAEEGLTFISLHQRILVSIPPDYYFHTSEPTKNACIPAINAFASGAEKAARGKTKNSVTVYLQPKPAVK